MTSWLARSYLFGFALWLALRALFGDAFWWLYVLNVGTDYLVVCLPLAIFFALPFRGARWVPTGISLVLAVVFVGNVRPPASSARADGPSLAIMTFNVSAGVLSTDPMVGAVRRADADVVCFQELNPEKAATIESALKEQYPYQILRPHSGGHAGMGIISRYPIRPIERATVDSSWIGPPLIAAIEWAGTEITLVNAHAIHAFSSRPSRQETLNAVRLYDADHVVGVVREHPGPVVLCADFNATPHGDVYAHLSSALVDSWREAGVGPGYTWNVFPIEFGAFRIDYVMHSRELRAVQAVVEPWDGASDHRPVSARLVLKR
jgi:vancomycin resistance protein VanJ